MTHVTLFYACRRDTTRDVYLTGLDPVSTTLAPLGTPPLVPALTYTTAASARTAALLIPGAGLRMAVPVDKQPPNHGEAP